MATGRPKHGYFLSDGTKVPGVTTILGGFKDPGALMWWSWNVAHEGLERALTLLEGVRAESPNWDAIDKLLSTDRDHWHYRKRSGTAAEIGTVAHSMIELHLRGEDPHQAQGGMPDYVIQKSDTAFLAFLEWADRNALKVVKSELSLVSEKHRFGGTLDNCVLSLRGQTALGDWKTSNGIYADMLYQVSAYRELHVENFPDEKLDGGYYIFRFDKETGDFHEHHFNELGAAWEGFLLMRRLFDINKELEKRVK